MNTLLSKNFNIREEVVYNRMNGNTFLWASRKKGHIIFKISLSTNQNVRSIRKCKVYLAVLRQREGKWKAEEKVQDDLFHSPYPLLRKMKNSCFLFLEILKLSPDFKNLLDQQSCTEDVFAAYSCQLSRFFLKSVLIMPLFSKWRTLYYIYKLLMRTLPLH